jgi:hypothetical protein
MGNVTINNNLNINLDLTEIAFLIDAIDFVKLRFKYLTADIPINVFNELKQKLESARKLYPVQEDEFDKVAVNIKPYKEQF